MNILIKNQNGFGLVTAIFLLVVLAALGGVMMTFFTSQQQSLATDVLGSRAYQAARAGIELGAYDVAAAASGAGCSGYPKSIAAGSMSGGLAPFSVQVLCTPSSASEGGATVYIYKLTSTAGNGVATGSPDRVERSITAWYRQ